jgi:hypothetical protein
LHHKATAKPWQLLLRCDEARAGTIYDCGW